MFNSICFRVVCVVLVSENIKNTSLGLTVSEFHDFVMIQFHHFLVGFHQFGVTFYCQRYTNVTSYSAGLFCVTITWTLNILINFITTLFAVEITDIYFSVF
jgi:hypothetical protein